MTVPDNGQPEVDFHQPRRIHALAFPEPGNDTVDRAERDQCDPAQRARVDVSDGPIRVVRQRVDRADRQERPFERGQSIEHRRRHHEAKRRVVANLVPGAVERSERVSGRSPGGHQQDQREGHAERLNPLRQRRVVQVVGTRPHVHEGDAPEADDGKPVRIDRPPGTLRQVVVHHAEEPGSQEEGHRVVAVPPLGHRVLDARKGGIALGMSQRHRDGKIVHDVQDRDNQDERHVVPVGDVDVRFLPPRQRADIDERNRSPRR